MLNGKVESLEEELNTARLQAKQLQDTQKKDFAVKVKSLEATISSLQDELQVSKSKPADLLNESSESTDSSARAQSELATWQEQIKVLNASLEKANFEKDTSDQKAQELASELSSLKISLQLKTKIASYGFPAATASGALAAVGVMAFLKNFRRQ
jgi:chromosome segregation ATPase